MNILILCSLSNRVGATILPSCGQLRSASKQCSAPLGDIMVVEPSQFIVAKLQCYGCPTTAKFEKGGHKITHEENALVYTPFPPCPTIYPRSGALVRLLLTMLICSSSISASHTIELNSSSTPTRSSPLFRPLHRDSTLPKFPSISASPPCSPQSNVRSSPVVISTANATALREILVGCA